MTHGIHSISETYRFQRVNNLWIITTTTALCAFSQIDNYVLTASIDNKESSRKITEVESGPEIITAPGSAHLLHLALPRENFFQDPHAFLLP